MLLCPVISYNGGIYSIFWKAQMVTTEDINIASQELLITPDEIKEQLPMPEAAQQLVKNSRQTIRNILDGKDHRLFVVLGPCSIHDVEAALDYAKRLKTLSEQVSDTLYLVMRVYFEKPRTTVGWKGLINDPYLDDSFKIQEGLLIGRELLLNILEIGLPTATEALDPISPQYMQDCISWSAIGARTTESQTHREMASGLSSPIGFKNGTDGGLGVALNALQSASSPHRFLGINKEGQVSVVHTKGNPYAHVVLRGGSNGPNYSSEHTAAAEQELNKAGLKPNIMIDCSHANSNKQHKRQLDVINEVAKNISSGDNTVVGLMIESHINEGNQKLGSDKSALEYGVSITDACINWEDTEKAILQLAASLKDILPKRAR